MITATLQNSFHNTEVRVLVPQDWVIEDELWVWDEIKFTAYRERKSGVQRGPWTRKVERIRRELCGVHDCSCGIVRS